MKIVVYCYILLKYYISYTFGHHFSVSYVYQGVKWE